MTFEVLNLTEVNWMTGEKRDVPTVKVGNARVRLEHESEAQHFISELNKLLRSERNNITAA